MRIQCWCCSLTCLLIGVSRVWSRKQHQILIINPQTRVTLKHLVGSVTSQFLKVEFTKETHPQCINLYPKCNSLAHSALMQFSDIFVFTIICNYNVHIDLGIRKMITLSFCYFFTTLQYIWRFPWAIAFTKICINILIFTWSNSNIIQKEIVPVVLISPILTAAEVG